MITGMIKIWHRDKGWGFISGDDGDDYFVNAANVRSGQRLRVGLKVKFDAAETSRGTIAENVSLY